MNGTIEDEEKRMSVDRRLMSRMRRKIRVQLTAEGNDYVDLVRKSLWVETE